MTIVIQHQFWDLKVNETQFEIGLSFSDVPERLVIPFAAVRGFYDPSVNFELEFDPAAADEPAAQAAEVTAGGGDNQDTAADARERRGVRRCRGGQGRRRRRFARLLPQEELIPPPMADLVNLRQVPQAEAPRREASVRRSRTAFSMAGHAPNATLTTSLNDMERRRHEARPDRKAPALPDDPDSE